MPFKIRTKLITAFMVMLIPVLVLFVFNHFQLKTFQRSARQIDEVAKEISCLSDLQLALEMVIMPANDYLITGDISEKEKFYQLLKETEAHFNQLSGQRICRGCHAGRENIFDILLGIEVKENWPDEMRLLKGIRDGIERISDKGEEVFNLERPIGSKEGAALMEEMDTMAHRLITEDIRRHKESDGRELDLSVKAAERARGRYLIIRTVGYSLVVVIGLFFALFYSRLFVVPIKKLHNGADAIATGDFKTRVNIKTGDEIEQLANAMNEMAAQLDSVYSSLERQVEERTRELQFERDKLIKIFEAMEDGVYLVDQNYDVQYTNPSLEREYGPWKGVKCYKYFHDRTEVCPWCPNQRIWAGETVRWEWYSFKTGKTFDLIDAPLKQPDGTNWKLEIFRDITDRKKAEEITKNLFTRYATLLAAVPEIVMEVDDNKVYVWGNKAGLEFFGEDVIGKEAASYFEGEQKTYSIVQPLFNGHEETIYVESWQRRKDGQKRLLAWWCQTLKDAYGKVKGAISTARDITEYKKAEEALRDSETRYKGLVESVTDYIFTVQIENGRPVKTAHGPGCVAKTGYTSEEYGTDPALWFQMVYEGDRDAVVRQAEGVVSGKAEPLEHRIITKDGKIKWVRNVPVPP